MQMFSKVSNWTAAITCNVCTGHCVWDLAWDLSLTSQEMLRYKSGISSTVNS